jgi:glutamate 5-kinase
MNLFEQANIVVIKVGAAFVADYKTTVLKQSWVDSLVDDAASLATQGKKIVIVSSGAIPLGCNNLKLNPTKLKLQEKQNASICGQHELMQVYKQSFARHGLQVAQALITTEDTENRKRFLAIKTAIEYLLESNIIPIVNENDLIANTEIRFGDNDRLSARVAQIVNADFLVMLSLVDGLFTADPQIYRGSEFIKEVYEITSDIEKMATDSQNKTGGMSAKIVAAKMALHANCNVAIINGNFNHPIKRVIEGARFTSFIANSEDVSKKYKIG